MIYIISNDVSNKWNHRGIKKYLRDALINEILNNQDTTPEYVYDNIFIT